MIVNETKLNSNIFIKRLKFFGRNSGIHGLVYLFGENTNFLARLFWLSILLASTGCLYLLLLPALERGEDVSYTPDTLYLPWTTTFPAVTICESYSSRAMQRRFREKYPELMDSMGFDFKKHLADMSFGRSAACTGTLCLLCDEVVPCNLPWREIIENLHKKCPDLLTNCSYNGHEFPCCKKFIPVDSEYGECYSFNTRQSEESGKEPLLTVNRTTGPASISFRISSDVQISLHSPEEISTSILNSEFKLDVRIRTENQVHFLFTIAEITNDPALKYIKTGTKGCRDDYELINDPFHNYKIYSYGACRLAYATTRQYTECGCVHPVRHKSYEDKYCNYTGMNCLANYAAQMIQHGTNLNENHNEDCLPNCWESELSILHISRHLAPESPDLGAAITVQMAALPTLRYQRKLMNSNLDLVVTVGSMVGLFFSASILSIVEIVYLFLRKP